MGKLDDAAELQPERDDRREGQDAQEQRVHDHVEDVHLAPPGRIGLGAFLAFAGFALTFASFFTAVNADLSNPYFTTTYDERMKGRRP